MKKQLLFLALAAGIIVSNVEAMNVIQRDPSQMLEDLKMEFKDQVFETFNNLEDVLAANSTKKFNLYGDEWSILTRNLDKYAGTGFVGKTTTMSVLSNAIFNAIKDTYKDLKNAKTTSFQGQSVRSGNAYDFLDRVLFLIRVHNSKVK